MAITIETNLGIERIGRRGDSSRFEQLVQDLKDALGQSSGLTCDDVDVEYLRRLMNEYDGKEDKGWRPYFLGDATRGYTRNLVDEGNGKSNLVR
jgi:cysteine dioxygenase